MGFLKLWGRVLARLQHDPALFLVHSAVNKMDVEKSGATAADAENIIREMTLQLGFAKIHVFFQEIDQDSTEVFCSYPASLELMNTFNDFSPVVMQPHSMRFVVPEELMQAEKSVMERIKKEASKLA
jgi:hypothetical protein